MLVLEGRAYIEGRLEDCAIGIEDGKIVSIKKLLSGDQHADYGDLLLLPGGIDVHVHFREPGMTYKEDFQSGSVSAGVGGITAVFDMPNTLPPTTTLRTYEEKLNIVSGKAFVDFGLHASLLKPDEVARLAAVAAGLKLYLAPTTGGLDVPMENIQALLEQVPQDAPPIVVHAENPEKLGHGKARDLPGYNLARPMEAESSSILALRQMNRILHITHVTSGEAVKALESSGFTADVTPHHLLLDCASQLGQRGKINPPLREPSERGALWKAFAAGRVGILASDHAPHTEEEKALNFDDAPAGMPGVETMMPLLIRKVKSMDVAIERLVSAVSEMPAKLMGLDKGRIAVGMDADIAVFDSRQVTKIRGKNLHSKCGWTAFEGWEGIFPRAVYLRGTLIVDRGEVVEDLLGEPVSVKRGAQPSPAGKPEE